MKTYTIRFTECKRSGNEGATVLEMERLHLTSREFRQVIDELVFLAWFSKASLITAEVFCDGQSIATVRALSEIVAANLIRIVKIQVARQREAYRTIREIPMAA